MPTTTATGHNTPHQTCVDLIRRHDEDLFLALPYALAKDRPRLAALFALHVELRRIPRLVSEAPLGEIRLQWWREALDEIAAGARPRAHPVVEALSASGAMTEEARVLADRMIDARARLLYAPEFLTLDDLGEFLREAEAPLAALAAGETASVAQGDIIKGGEAYALARFAPVLAPALAAAAAAASLKLHRHSSLHGRVLPPAIIGSVAFLALTRGHAARSDGRPWPLLKRIALFRAALCGRLSPG